MNKSALTLKRLTQSLVWSRCGLLVILKTGMRTTFLVSVWYLVPFCLSLAMSPFIYPVAFLIFRKRKELPSNSERNFLQRSKRKLVNTYFWKRILPSKYSACQDILFRSLPILFISRTGGPGISDSGISPTLNIILFASSKANSRIFSSDLPSPRSCKTKKWGRFLTWKFKHLLSMVATKTPTFNWWLYFASWEGGAGGGLASIFFDLNFKLVILV